MLHNNMSRLGYDQRPQRSLRVKHGWARNYLAQQTPEQVPLLGCHAARNRVRHDTAVLVKDREL